MQRPRSLGSSASRARISECPWRGASTRKGQSRPRSPRSHPCQPIAAIGAATSLSSAQALGILAELSVARTESRHPTGCRPSSGRPDHPMGRDTSQARSPCPLHLGNRTHYLRKRGPNLDNLWTLPRCPWAELCRCVDGYGGVLRVSARLCGPRPQIAKFRQVAAGREMHSSSSVRILRYGTSAGPGPCRGWPSALPRCRQDRLRAPEEVPLQLIDPEFDQAVSGLRVFHALCDSE